MNATSFYPVLMSGDVVSAADFYRTHIGFQTTFEADWYISLRLGAFELALVDAAHPTIPEGFRATPRGVIVNLEVDDVDAVHARMVDAGVEPVRALRNEGFGQRHFIVEAPDGVLLDVITPIVPSADYADAYVG